MNLESLVIKFQLSRSDEVFEKILRQMKYNIYHTANKVSYRSNEDLILCGEVGVFKAAERFDISKGFKFKTFADSYIRGEILKFHRDYGSLIREPAWYQEKKSKEGNRTPDNIICLFSQQEKEDGEEEKNEFPVWDDYRLWGMTVEENKIINFLVDGYSQGDIALMMGVSPATISKRVKYIKEKILLRQEEVKNVA